jgi:glycosyltransferase involved in cell wall biosynthesis
MIFNVIIPTYNNLKNLKACLVGLSAQTFTSFKAIICIDGSTDSTVEYLAHAHYPFPFVAVEHADHANHGRNATRNLAIPHIDSTYILFLDSDAVPAPDLLEKHLACLTTHSGVSVGAMHYINARDNLWARYLMTRGRSRIPVGKEIPFRLFNSGNAAFPFHFFTDLGGQDPAMTHYGAGDTEFAIRLYDRFHPHFFNTRDAIACSTMDKSLDTALSQMVELGKFNLKHLYHKHPSHRDLYGMNAMKRYGFIFYLLSRQPIPAVCRLLAEIPTCPLQLLLVWYLVIASVYRGFSSK